MSYVAYNKVWLKTLVRYTIIKNNNDKIVKLYIPYIDSKFIEVFRQNKSMMPRTNKLKKIQIDLYGLCNLSSQVSAIYTVILIHKYTNKM